MHVCVCVCVCVVGCSCYNTVSRALHIFLHQYPWNRSPGFFIFINSLGLGILIHTKVEKITALEGLQVIHYLCLTHSSLLHLWISKIPQFASTEEKIYFLFRDFDFTFSLKIIFMSHFSHLLSRYNNSTYPPALVEELNIVVHDKVHIEYFKTFSYYFPFSYFQYISIDTSIQEIPKMLVKLIQGLAYPLDL